MKEKLLEIQKTFKENIEKIKSPQELEDFYQKYFSRKSGFMTIFMKDMKDLSIELKKEIGQMANVVKKEMEDIYKNKQNFLENNSWDEIISSEKIDISQPKINKKRQGHMHPMTTVHNELEDLFTSMGFIILDGPELESDFYNFEALNVSKNHPARDSQDTFFIKDNKDWVMRTHTSPMQVRAMQKYGVPLRAVVDRKSVV